MADDKTPEVVHATIAPHEDGHEVTYTDDDGEHSFVRDTILSAVHDVRILFGPDAVWRESGSTPTPGPVTSSAVPFVEETK